MVIKKGSKPLSWMIDWKNPDDPLRRAVLGKGEKRPTVAPKRPLPPKDMRYVWDDEKQDYVLPWIDPRSR
jgi:hypothetical protein